jgi:nucleoside phosphorylase
MGMFRIYRSESMALVISGVGKSLSAAATGYLCGSSDGWRNAPWINVGVAGHRNVDVGELIVANKIVDQSTAHSWYPPQLVSNVVNSTLITVDEPEETYPERAAYDMEAAGFFPAATRCSSGELVQSIKVISDNPHQSIASLNARSIKQLITKNVSKIEQFINRLSELSTEIKVLPHHGSLPESWANRWSFSVTQSHRLRRLLQRWGALIGDAETLDAALSACKDGAAVLTALEERLNAEKPTYGRSSLAGPRVSPMPKVHSP